MYNKFKSIITDDAYFYSAVIVLVALVCFGLGRWSVGDTLKNSTEKGFQTIKMNQVGAVVNSQNKNTATTSSVSEVKSASNFIPLQPSTEKKYVGSKTGTKYHLLTCAGAKTIKDTNKIYFSSKDDAEKQGYKPASNCKGI